MNAAIYLGSKRQAGVAMRAPGRSARRGRPSRPCRHHRWASPRASSPSATPTRPASWRASGKPMACRPRASSSPRCAVAVDGATRPDRSRCRPPRSGRPAALATSSRTTSSAPWESRIASRAARADPRYEAEARRRPGRPSARRGDSDHSHRAGGHAASGQPQRALSQSGPVTLDEPSNTAATYFTREASGPCCRRSGWRAASPVR